MPKTHNNGGQMRNIQCTCGWSVRKAIREANHTYERHLRYCPDITNKNEIKEIIKGVPKKADSAQIEINGWKGLKGIQVANSCVHNITVEGQTYIIFAPATFASLDKECRQAIIGHLIDSGAFALSNTYTIKGDDDLMMLMIQAVARATGKDVNVIFA